MICKRNIPNCLYSPSLIAETFFDGRLDFVVTLSFGDPTSQKVAETALLRFAEKASDLMKEESYIPHGFDAVSFMAVPDYTCFETVYHLFLNCADPKFFHMTAKSIWQEVVDKGSLTFCEESIMALKPFENTPCLYGWDERAAAHIRRMVAMASIRSYRDDWLFVGSNMIRLVDYVISEIGEPDEMFGAIQRGA